MIDYGGCGSITPVANLVAVVPVVPVLSIDSVAVVRLLQWWLSFDRLRWLWFDHSGGCQAVVPVAPGAVDPVAPVVVVPVAQAVDRSGSDVSSICCRFLTRSSICGLKLRYLSPIYSSRIWNASGSSSTWCRSQFQYLSFLSPVSVS